MTEDLFLLYAMTLVRAAGVTIQISWLALLLAALAGTIVAFARMSDSVGLRMLALAYTELMRSIPVILMLFFCFYGFPAAFGLDVSPFVAATAALGLHASGSMSEVVRAGVESVGKGQWDAAQASGMRLGSVLRYVVAPQAFRVILPPAVSILVATIKASSLAVVIGYRELMHAALFIRDQTNHSLYVIIIAALMYFGICYSISYIARALERRLGRHAENSSQLIGRQLEAG